MNRGIDKQPRAETDLIDCFGYIGEHGGLEAADRFLEAVDATLRLIAKTPGIGAPHETDKPRLEGVRCTRVSKFKKYLLFYRSFDDRIELVRVLHGARDIDQILDDEE